MLSFLFSTLENLIEFGYFETYLLEHLHQNFNIWNKNKMFSK